MRRTSTFRLVILIVALPILVTVLWASSASAYPTYSCDGTNDDPALCFDGADGTNPDSGNCANCHGGFRQSGYVSNTADDPAAWNNNLMSGHANTFGLSCSDCHYGIATSRTPTYLYSSATGVTCATCHGREEDITANDGAFGGPEPGRGDGLRAHHELAVGPGTCNSCHTGINLPTRTTTTPRTSWASTSRRRHSLLRASTPVTRMAAI